MIGNSNYFLSLLSIVKNARLMRMYNLYMIETEGKILATISYLNFTND